MSRELKFRIWDTKLKQFLINDCFEAGDISINIKRLREQIFCDRKLGEKYGFISFFPSNINDLIFQEWTGILDSKNREIFEGDVVKFQYEVYEHEFEEEIGEVYFEDGIFYFGRKNQFATNDCNFRTESLEVLGNIFENPSLLKT